MHNTYFHGSKYKKMKKKKKKKQKVFLGGTMVLNSLKRSETV